jgi:hypothetical protein
VRVGIVVRVARAIHDVRRELGERGYATVTSSVVAHGEALKVEADGLHAAAERVEKDAYELWADGQEFRSPVRYGFAPETSDLKRLHGSRELRELAGELADAVVEPTYSGYLFYEDGDFIGLHTDLPACELTLLVAVEDDCPPLVVHPELAGMGGEELKALSEVSRGAPEGGLALPIVPGSTIALFGGGLPHQTRPIPEGRASIVATLCYAGV